MLSSRRAHAVQLRILAILALGHYHAFAQDLGIMSDLGMRPNLNRVLIQVRIRQDWLLPVSRDLADCSTSVSHS